MSSRIVPVAILGALCCAPFVWAQAPKPPAAAKTAPPGYASATLEKGSTLFVTNCAFCHGRDAGGGEDGPDLTRSKLVSEDTNGEKIGPVVKNGRPQNGMPAFGSLSNDDILAITAFIHAEKMAAESQNGKRRGVSVEDLQTGNVAAGKAYFEGAGGCAGCHSPTGDLKGIASKVKGLQLEMRLLYPRGAKSKATITTKSGETVTGEVAYHDEFTIAVRDANGKYHGFRTQDVTFKIDSPADAHAQLLAKYSDDDIHNLMAYLQTLK